MDLNSPKGYLSKYSLTKEQRIYLLDSLLQSISSSFFFPQIPSLGFLTTLAVSYLIWLSTDSSLHSRMILSPWKCSAFKENISFIFLLVSSYALTILWYFFYYCSVTNQILETVSVSSFFLHTVCHNQKLLCKYQSELPTHNMQLLLYFTNIIHLFHIFRAEITTVVCNIQHISSPSSLGTKEPSE